MRIHVTTLRNCFLKHLHGYREALYENNEIPKEARDLAALLASKVYYFLGEYDEALSFALGAGNAFDAEARTYGSEEYIETVVCTSTCMERAFRELA